MSFRHYSGTQGIGNTGKLPATFDHSYGLGEAHEPTVGLGLLGIGLLVLYMLSKK